MSWIRDNTLNWFQHIAVRIIRAGHVPKHVAIIMDGNRRYANKNNVEKIEGHTRGFDKLAESLQWCMDLGISEVTVYAFSIENFKRTKEEVDCLMELASQKFQRLLDEKEKLMEHGVCVRVIGNLSLIPDKVKRHIAEAMFLTKDNNNAILNVAFAYTSRDEITYAIKDVLDGVKSTDIKIEDINDDLLSKCLYTYKSPDPDLLIRTSGEHRLSDFLMWQCTNTYIHFVNVLWPEFSVWDFLRAIFFYQRYYSQLIKEQGNIHLLNPIISSYIKKLYLKRTNMLQKMVQL